jgi:ATP-dependent helicase/nuclease subunit A
VRNLDKLLEDARESQLIQVSAFLEYLTFLRASGVRAGEAVSDAQDSVQLMTIHKSKGLEFPLVVLADAGKQERSATAPGLLLPETGIALKLSRLERDPMLYGYARMLEGAKDGAETLRLMYVACTRAQDKLIFSGHVSDKGSSAGYLKLLDLDYKPALGELGQIRQLDLGVQGEIGLVVHGEETLAKRSWEGPAGESKIHPNRVRLYKPIVEPKPPVTEDGEGEESELSQRDWRATGGRYAPALVVGGLVHKALQRWQFPGEEGYSSLMQASLAREGVVDREQVALVLEETEQLLERFRSHDLYQEIQESKDLTHEIPYAYVSSGNVPETGIMDLLYRDEKGWQVVDFKTDELSDEEDLEKAVKEYTHQLSGYRRAGRALLRESVRTRICFLDYQGGVRLVEV